MVTRTRTTGASVLVAAFSRPFCVNRRRAQWVSTSRRIDYSSGSIRMPWIYVVAVPAINRTASAATSLARSNGMPVTFNSRKAVVASSQIACRPSATGGT